MIFDFLRNKVIEIKLISPPPWKKICVLNQKNEEVWGESFASFQAVFIWSSYILSGGKHLREWPYITVI